MPTAALVEDEPLLRAHLRELLASLWPGLQVVAEFADGRAAMAALPGLRPDVVFLDIDVPSANGLRVAASLDEACAVVFVTASDRHSLEAFDVGAADYVVKPIERARLARTVERLQVRLASRSEPSRDGAAPQPAPRATEAPRGDADATSTRAPIRWIRASQGDMLRLVTVDEVVYFQSADKYTRVVTAAGELVIRTSVRELLEMLDAADFQQVHRGSIVNLRCVEAVARDGAHMEILLRGRTERLAVSQTYQSRFRQM